MIPIRDDTPRFSTPYVTYLIIALNTVVFLFEYSLGKQSQRALHALWYQFGAVPVHFERAMAGASNATLLALSITILTSMFLHASWLHIIGNMWFLWIFGDNIEDYLGHFPYLVFYLISGFAAMFTHILLNAGSNVPALGASGAIAGVMGGYFVLYPRARVMMWFPPIFFFYLPAWLVLGYWFFTQFLSGAATSIAGSGATGGIAVWAHVGGFVAGIVLIKLVPERRGRRRYAAW
ncbi:MAG: rhomboid family intramembrane serine protease [Terriglobales bacterium]